MTVEFFRINLQIYCSYYHNYESNRFNVTTYNIPYAQQVLLCFASEDSTMLYIYDRQAGSKCISNRFLIVGQLNNFSCIYACIHKIMPMHLTVHEHLRMQLMFFKCGYICILHVLAKLCMTKYNYILSPWHKPKKVAKTWIYLPIQQASQLAIMHVQ